MQANAVGGSFIASSKIDPKILLHGFSSFLFRNADGLEPRTEVFQDLPSNACASEGRTLSYSQGGYQARLKGLRMVGAPVSRSHAAVQRIVNQMRHHSKRVILKDVYVTPTDARAILPVTEKHLPDLRGHFPRNPVVPAVVMLEAMFQLAAVLGQENGIRRHLDCIQEARFRRIVTPEDRELRVKVWDDEKGYRGIAEVGEITVAEALFGE